MNGVMRIEFVVSHCPTSDFYFQVFKQKRRSMQWKHIIVILLVFAILVGALIAIIISCLHTKPNEENRIEHFINRIALDRFFHRIGSDRIGLSTDYC